MEYLFCTWNIALEGKVAFSENVILSEQKADSEWRAVHRLKTDCGLLGEIDD